MEFDDDDTLMIIELATGEVVIELLPQIAPLHVARIQTLVEADAYDDVAFHRVIEGFVAQAGDVQYGDLDDGFDPARVGTGQSDLPDLPLEPSEVSFQRGIVGMARTTDPDSANSQFFITYGDASFLDGQYTVFGNVVEGMELVDGLQRVQSQVVDGARVLVDPEGMQVVPDRMIEVELAEPDEFGVTTAEAQAVALLYEAGLGREAAFLGLNFWIDKVETGASLTRIADAFLDSDEFEARVGDPDTLSDDAFITGLFENVIGRAPAQAGFEFWTGRLEAGATRAETLLAFAIEPENAAQSPRVETLARLGDADGDDFDPDDVLPEDREAEWFFDA